MKQLTFVTVFAAGPVYAHETGVAHSDIGFPAIASAIGVIGLALLLSRRMGAARATCE